MAERAEAATAPLPDRLGGISITADGVRLPLSSVRPTEIWFQVPFEMRPGTTRVAVEIASLFVGCGGVRRNVVERAPFFFGQSDLTLAHDRMSRRVRNGRASGGGSVCRLGDDDDRRVSGERPYPGPRALERLPFPELRNPRQSHRAARRRHSPSTLIHRFHRLVTQQLSICRWMAGAASLEA